MRVLLASDPFGGSLREALAEHLASRSPTLQVEDRGAFAKYYQAAHQVAGEVEAAAAARADPRPPPLLAVLVDSSGAGVCICANKYRHVAAVVCGTPEAARAARASHAANVLCLGGRTTAAVDACSIVDAFLEAQPGDGLAPGMQRAAEEAAAAISTLDYSRGAVAAAAGTPKASSGGTSLSDMLLGSAVGALLAAALGLQVLQRGRG